jgi:hypothetical protein
MLRRCSAWNRARMSSSSPSYLRLEPVELDAYTATTTVLARYDEERREQAESARRGDGFSGEPSASGVVERGDTPLRLRNRPSRPRNTRYPKGCGSRSGRASAGSDFSREATPRLPCPGDSASVNPSGELPNEPLMNRKLTGDSDTAAREGLRCGGSSPWDATGVPRGKGPPFQRERNIRPAPGRGLFPSCRGSGTRD